ncbi:MAG: hypothetical protein FJX44_03335 [Alphaproteobacteria bacterium]|nr:hypothetical protein [Alphaproteobacteria bacterium]
MKPIFVVFLLVLGACVAHGADKMETPKEMVLLTVGGDIAVTNRGPFDPDTDSLFSRFKITFDRAFAFDRPMLLRLKQGTVTVKTPELGRTATFTGPLLNEVLAAVGAARAKVSLMAVNGFEGWLDPDDIDNADWILALTADGKPLGLGQQGPIWLVKSLAESESRSEDRRGHWVWAVMYLHVGDRAMEAE